MTPSQRTYCKALLLFIVFSLNTVVGFACSFSNLFHNAHHSPTTTKHHHSESKQHQHGKGHSHQSKHQDQHDADPKENTKDDCCTDKVIAVEKVDKSVSRSIEAPQINFIISFIEAYASFLSVDAEDNTLISSHVRWRPTATIQDLRIVIQSFQI